MDARTALKNFNDRMVKVYGANYVEHWTEDDRETFEILARNARKEVTAAQRRKADTSFLRVMMNGKRDPEYATEQAKIAAWNALVDHNGTTGVVGTLSPTSGLYDGAQPRKRRVKAQATPVAPAVPKISADDVDSNNIFAYLMGE